MTQYMPILALFILATLFAGLSFAASSLLAPRRSTPAKSAPYECGIVPDREPAERFPVRFYLVAMIFIIFDIEIIFLYPWAVVFDQQKVFLLVEMLVFSGAVFVAFVYLISNGALDWGPVKRLRPATPVSPARTSETTIRRLGPGPDAGQAA
ncbi:MAG TPA: NADH-quinone oxidoreductase subunit A [Acidimicrobiales bacterium]|nr:NADH-quinone oxidoreductase subunit A [Acidimicrobiales bacterium]